MLSLFGQPGAGHCDGTTRRDVLRIGSLGAAGLSLSNMLADRSQARAAGASAPDTSVIWLFLAGGVSQIETFDPKMSAPAEIRSVTGEVATALPGVTFGGNFPKLATLADKIAVFRSFAHTNSSHQGGRHYVMTGYDDPAINGGANAKRPGFGAFTAKARGPNHPVSGMPTYVRLGGTVIGDGPAYLGPSFGPFDPEGEAVDNLRLNAPLHRLDDRRRLLSDLDRLRREVDARHLLDGLSDFEQQAFDLVLGKAPQAFDLRHEDPQLVARYKQAVHVRTNRAGLPSVASPGEWLLRARRLCEAGCGFVNIVWTGWDHHGVNGTYQIKDGMDQMGPVLDHAVATFVEDLYQRGLERKILLVITGEFGRTPRISAAAGRDHWAPLSTLALVGGGLNMGQVIGKSSSKAEVPATTPYGPRDLMATIFEVLGMDRQMKLTDREGRPIIVLEDGRPVPELF